MKVLNKAAKIVLKKARYKRRNSIRTLSQWLASPVKVKARGPRDSEKTKKQKTKQRLAHLKICIELQKSHWGLG